MYAISFLDIHRKYIYNKIDKVSNANFIAVARQKDCKSYDFAVIAREGSVFSWKNVFCCHLPRCTAKK